MNKSFHVLVALMVGLSVSTPGRTDSGVNKQSSKQISAASVSYNNRTSGLKAKTSQAAIDEIGATLAAALKGRSNSIRSLSAAKAVTGWTGLQYYFAAGSTPNVDVIKEAPITVEFSVGNDTEGSFTISPVNFVCPRPEDFTQAACSSFGDTFSYDYKIFGTNLLVTNGRTSSGALIGSELPPGIGPFGGFGKALEIQNQGTNRLVLKFNDASGVVLYDLKRAN